MFLRVCFLLVMGRVEVLTMKEVRFARRCWVYIGGAEDYEEEVVVVKVGDMYVVGAVDDWYAVPVEAVRRLLARWFNVGEEEVSLEC
jgi:hypothetical protein